MDDRSRPLCLLALDGGGIRGLSELLVLEEIMNRIKYDLRQDEDLLPADFFDLIGGTSTGGLIALLLGRLRRSVPQARTEYVRIAEEVFSFPTYLKKNSFDGGKLEDAVKKLLGTDRSEEKMLEKDVSCKVFVCAVPQQDIKARAGPRLFRTYCVRENASFNCTIWEACRATSAAPSYFEPIQIGDDGEQETFVDGGLGYNNPVEQVLEEASRIFPGRKVACVVSIGTGVASAIAFPDSPKTSPVKLIKALKKMATESDTTAEKIHKRFQNVKDTYFRFSVDRGLQGIGLEEWKELSNVRSFTTEYLKLHIVSEQVNKVVKGLLASKAVSQEGPNRLIQFSRGSSGAGSSQGPPRTIEWQPNQGSIPSFRYTTEQLVSQIPKFLPQRHWTVPFGKNKNFVGRASILAQLLEKISPVTEEDDCQRTAIEGLGGIGKTQIAIEAAFRVRDQHPDCSIFWVPAVDTASFEKAYHEIGQKLKVPGIDEDEADIKKLVQTALCRDGAGLWLLIVDNADDADLLFGGNNLADYLPFSRKGSILFTTRNHKVIGELDIPRSNVMVVEEMSKDEALELFKTCLDEGQIGDTEGTTRLFEFLAYLPLALRQAAAYMATHRISATIYFEFCQSSEKDAIELLSENFKDRHRYNTSQNPVATTWLISFRHISRDNPLAAEYLQFMSFLSEKNIPNSLLPSSKQSRRVLEAIGTLKGYAFISEQSDQGPYDMHRLVSLAMRNWLDKEKKLKECATMVICRLNKVFPYPTHENRATWETYLPHAQKVLGFRDETTDKLAMLSLLFNVGTSNVRLGVYAGAGAMYTEVIDLQREVLGDKHPETIKSMASLAWLYSKQGKNDEAEKRTIETIGLQRDVLGDKHQETIKSMASLASIYSKQGKNDEAEKRTIEVIDLQREVLGGKHPDTIASMAALAWIYSKQGKNDEAQERSIEALSLQREVLGGKHPETIKSMASLAWIYSKQGKNDEAEKRSVEVIGLWRQVRGDKHPDTIKSMATLAWIYSKQGKNDEAEKRTIETIGLQRDVLGDKHPETIKSMASLAWIYSKQGRTDEAEKRTIEAIGLQREVLGDKHPDTIASMASLASICSKQGKNDEAEERSIEVLGLQREVLGDKHPETIGSMAALASIYCKQGKNDEAEKRTIETIGLWREVFDDKHPDTIASMATLASIYSKQGKNDEAERCCIEVIGLQQEVLGGKHPSTIKSMASLASIYSKQGKNDEAEKRTIEVIGLWREVLGNKHPDTIASMAGLAGIYSKQGKNDEAEERTVEVIGLQREVLGDKHPETIASMASLASIHSKQGKNDVAERRTIEAIGLQREVLGDKHPNTIKSMASLASIYSKQGKNYEAEKRTIEVIGLWREVLGDKYPDTIASMAGLAGIYSKQGKNDEAERWYIAVIDLQREVLGDKHPNTIMSMASLAWIYSKQGKNDEAEKRTIEVIGLRRQVRGDKHPDTIASMAGLAGIYGRQGKNNEAERYYIAVIDLQREVLGDKHPNTIKSMASLAWIYSKQGKNDEAEKKIIEVIGLQREVLGDKHPDTIRSTKALERIYNKQRISSSQRGLSRRGGKQQGGGRWRGR